MYIIKNTTIDNAQYEEIKTRHWGTHFDGRVFFKLAYDNEGIMVNFKIEEKNPIRRKTKHFEMVCEDSCVEFFASFTPNESDKYLNLEVNANGAMYAAIRTGRHDPTYLLADEVERFGITPKIYEDYWTVSYKIGFELIKKYFPAFDISTCNEIKCNLYKCGDKTENEHYIAYFDVGTATPDFHCPKYFGTMKVEK